MAIATKAKRPTNNITHQRRTGAHQKQTKHFMQTYWPYLPLFSLAAVLIIIAGARMLGAPGAVIGSTTVGIAGVSLLI